MPNFEQFPQPSPEKPASKEEEARGVIRRLGDHVSQWREIYFAAMITGYASGVLSDFLKEKIEEHDRAEAAIEASSPEASPSLEVTIDDAQLRALDPEASPERVRVILDTLPKGFVAGEVSEIGFDDQVMPMPESYGHALSVGKGEAANAAGGTRAERTVITFFRGAKDSSSEWLWGDAVIHEIGHANDWDTDSQLSESERADLHARVKARVLSDDRFRSDYVEAITNGDAEAQLEERAKEYWAEIVSAYLGGKPMPEADAALVKDFVAKQDPTFDRDAQLARRRIVLQEMSVEESVHEYQRIPQAERDATDAWLDGRARLEAEPQDPETQREGRQAVVDAVRRWGKTPGGKEYMVRLMAYEDKREELFEARREGDPAYERMVLSWLVEAYDDLKTGEADFPEADMARGEIEGIMKGSGVWVGGEERQMVMDPEEYASYRFSDSEAWIPFNIGWKTPDYEIPEGTILRDYLDRKVFMTAE